MEKSRKNIILIIVLAIAIASAVCIFISSITSTTVNVYVDGENVTCSIIGFNENNQKIQKEICNYTLSSMYNRNSNLTTLKEGIDNICVSNGIKNPNVKIDSSLGENSYPAVFEVDGNSMFPTLKNGQLVIVNKTKDISVNDIVVSNTSQYGVIVKRVYEVDGNMIHLISDNTEVRQQEINGITYEIKGLNTWVDISTIFGTVEKY